MEGVIDGGVRGNGGEREGGGEGEEKGGGGGGRERGGGKFLFHKLKFMACFNPLGECIRHAFCVSCVAEHCVQSWESDTTGKEGEWWITSSPI